MEPSLCDSNENGEIRHILKANHDNDGYYWCFCGAIGLDKARSSPNTIKYRDGSTYDYGSRRKSTGRSKRKP